MGLEANRCEHLQFGEVLAAAGHEEATVIGEVSLSRIQSARCGG